MRMVLARALPIHVRSALPYGESGYWRRDVNNSQVCSDVGSLVCRAAVRQGFQLRRLRALRPVVGAWLTGIDGREYSNFFEGQTGLATNTDGEAEPFVARTRGVDAECDRGNLADGGAVDATYRSIPLHCRPNRRLVRSYSVILIAGNPFLRTPFRPC